MHTTAKSLFKMNRRNQCVETFGMFIIIWCQFKCEAFSSLWWNKDEIIWIVRHPVRSNEHKNWSIEMKWNEMNIWLCRFCLSQLDINSLISFLFFVASLVWVKYKYPFGPYLKGSRWSSVRFYFSTKLTRVIFWLVEGGRWIREKSMMLKVNRIKEKLWIISVFRALIWLNISSFWL